MACKTRSELECPIFGAPKCISENVLPTYEDMNRYFNWVEYEMKPLSTNPQQTATEATKVVAKKIVEIWDKASIPTVLQCTIIKRITSYRLKIRNLLKPYKQRNKVISYQKQLQDFRINSKVLFDVAACKCSDFNTCVCDKVFKVPQSERTFILDQRTVRKMFISSVDVKTTNMNQKRIQRNELWKTRSELHEKSMLQVKKDLETTKLVERAQQEPSTSRQVSAVRQGCSQIQRNSLQIPVLARTLDRYSISDRAGAAIASAVLQDVGIIKNEDKSSIFDKNKIRRARSKKREGIIDGKQNSSLRGLFFDGRSDETLKMEDSRRRKVREEHITLIKMPESVYLTHVCPESGTSSNIIKCILEYCDKSHITTDDLRVIGCDGTNVNVGKHSGIIANLEKHLNRPLQWFICQLHANELPLRHLINFLDGSTTGPKGFCGPIGQALKGCERLSIGNLFIFILPIVFIYFFIFLFS